MRIAPFFFALLALRVFGADAPAPAAVFPSELKLANGVTLHHATPTRWTNDYVVVKHAGGIDPIQYRYIAVEQRAIVAAVKQQEGGKPVASKTQAMRTLSGQVFVTTQGAGAYKFAGATVTAVTQTEFDYLKPIMENNLPLSYRNMHSWERDQALSKAWTATLTAERIGIRVTTDAEGKYTLEIPATGQFVLICTTYRMAGTSSEYNVWTVPTTEKATLDLNGGNSE